jgi:hypothetical protein
MMKSVLAAFAALQLLTGALLWPLLQNVLHAFSHLLDVGEADPAWLGPANLLALVLLSGLLVLTLNEAATRAS